ncbi:hypothetical protein KBTX_04155 [wastewater metagenome]|uniref:Uncharacterized protein n=2 Tax=unclassified sequences TaxID=12908 RepID=A0A5B8RJ85_9ZZZZ|nr:hypothetical protein KBTEX_04155 [uncultured organism]
MRRREGQVGVQQLLAHAPAPRRLRADEHVAEGQPREEQPVVVGHHPARCLAPAVQARHAGIAQGLRESLGAVPLAAVQGLARRRLELPQQVHGAGGGGVFRLLQQVADVAGGAREQGLRGLRPVQRQGPAQSRNQGGDRAAGDGPAHGRRQGVEPAPVGGGVHGVHPIGHPGEGVGLFGEVHAPFLKPFDHGLGVPGDVADAVAGGLEPAEDGDQGGGDVEVVRADVVPPRRVVVVDDGDALVGVGLALQRDPVAGTAGDGIHLCGQRVGHGELDAGERIDPGRLGGGEHHGLAHALELGHGQPIVDAVDGQAVRGEPPFALGAFAQADALEHRHVQRLQRPGGGLAAVAAADHEPLEADDRAQRGVAEALLQGLQRGDAGPPPACEQHQALGALLAHCLAQGVQQGALAGAVAGVVVQYGDHGTPRLQAEGVRRDDLAVVVVTQRRPGLRLGYAHVRTCLPGQVGEQAGGIGRTAAAPVGVGGEPAGLGRVLGGEPPAHGGGVLVRAGIGRERVQGGVLEPRQRLPAAEPREPVDGAVAAHADHGTGAAVPLHQPAQAWHHRVAEHGGEQHRVGALPQRGELGVRESGDLPGGAQHDLMAGMVGGIALGAGGQPGGRALGDDPQQDRAVAVIRGRRGARD